MHLEEKEYIVSIDVEGSYYCDGMSTVTFYTSSWTGRSACFGVAVNIGGEDPSEDGGYQLHSGDFNAENGSMITGVKISEGEITSVKKEKVPENGDRNWKDNHY